MALVCAPWDSSTSAWDASTKFFSGEKNGAGCKSALLLFLCVRGCKSLFTAETQRSQRNSSFSNVILRRASTRRRIPKVLMLAGPSGAFQICRRGARAEIHSRHPTGILRCAQDDSSLWRGDKGKSRGCYNQITT